MTNSLPQLQIPRAVCTDPTESELREWLVTNGLGSFASGTIAGTLTRRYHGLLIASLAPPGERMLLVSAVKETATQVDGSRFDLSADNARRKKNDPAGLRHIERFYLDGTTPVWEYRLGDCLLERRIWMQPGANTTCVRYKLLEGPAGIRLDAEILVNARGMHAETRTTTRAYTVERAQHGLKVTPAAGFPPFFLLCRSGKWRTINTWREDSFMAREAFRGLPDLDRHLAAGTCSWSLAPGEECMIVASMDASAELDSKTALNIRQDYELHLVGKAGAREETRARLCLAADQFIVRRPLADDPDGRTVIAGYHWFSDWGRDTMIALPGLTLSTGRPELAKKILSTFARFIDGGMLPNQFPEAGHAPEYNTVDAALWYFEAVRAYIEKTGDLPFLAEIFPILEEMVRFHVTGTRYNIHVDSSDGLLYAGTAGKQITWMDVKIGDWVVTPRIGKPVEINALWFNALKTMAHFCELLGRKEPRYDEMALRAKAGFERFWNVGQGFCFDVLDTPSGDDASLRPNQLFAVSLRHSPLTTARQKAVVDICAEQLLTPFGLRSLGPSEKAYAGRYGGDQVARDRVYHQGTVWGWLIGSFVQAHLKVYNDKSAARAFLEGLAGQTATHGLGTLSEIFEGDPPHAPRGAIAQAWTVAEWLRTMDLLD